MATSIPLSTLQPATPTAPTGPTCQTASNPSSAAGSGTAPGGLASVTRASNLITPNAAVSLSTAQTLAGPATAQPASTPVAGSKVRRWLKGLFDSLRMVASRCRCSKAVQRLLHICPKTWKGIFTLPGRPTKTSVRPAPAMLNQADQSLLHATKLSQARHNHHPL
jgi:hypothetical protein